MRFYFWKKVNKNTKQKNRMKNPLFIEYRKSEQQKCKSILFSVSSLSISLSITTVLVFFVVLSKQRITFAGKKSVCVLNFHSKRVPHQICVINCKLN